MVPYFYLVGHDVTHPFYDLIIAVWKADINEIRTLLEDPSRLDINTRFTIDRSPVLPPLNFGDEIHILHLVAARENLGRVEILQLLLSVPGIDKNPVDRKGQTPFMVACKKKASVLVSIFLDEPEVVPGLRDASNQSPEQILLSSEPQIPPAAFIVERWLLSGRPFSAEGLSLSEDTAVTRLIKSYLSDPADFVRRRRENEEWLSSRTEHLASAIEHRNLSAVTKIYQATPDMDINRHCSLYTWPSTLLQVAVNSNDYDIIEFLLRLPGIDVNATGGNPHGPLEKAVIDKTVHIVKLLLGHPGIDINAQFEGNRPCIYALIALRSFGAMEWAFANAATIQAFSEGKDAILKDALGWEGSEYRKPDNFCFLVHEYASCPDIIRFRSQGRMLNRPRDHAVYLFSLNVLHCDDHFRLRQRHEKGEHRQKREKAKRFFRLLSLLPMELQGKICLMVFGLDGHAFPSEKVTVASRLIFYETIPQQVISRELYSYRQFGVRGGDPLEYLNSPDLPGKKLMESAITTLTTLLNSRQ